MINNINPYNTRIRFGGLASGLDTDQIVRDMMRVERLPLNRLAQKRQLAEWKRDDYRNITNLLRGFQSEFFDVLKPLTNMRSQSTYQRFNVTSSDPSVVTAVGGAGAASQSHTITVNQLAAASRGTSVSMVSGTLKGDSIGSFNIDEYNKSFTLTYNGTSKTITMPVGQYASASDIVGNGSDGLLRQKVREAFNGVDVVVNGGAIEFTTANTSDTVSVSQNLVRDNLLSAFNINSSGAGGEITSFPLTISQGRKFTLSIVENGVTTTKELVWSQTKTYDGAAPAEDLAADIQAMIDAEFGSGKITVEGTDGKLSFNKSDDISSFSLSNSLNNNKVLGYLGLETITSNKLSLSDTMETVSSKLAAGGITFNGSGQFTLTINGVNITAGKNDTLSSFISQVNTSNAGVTLSYSSFTDKFTIVSKNSGSGSIALDDNGSNFFAKVGLTDIQAGQNAEFILNGEFGTRSSNSFAVDGVSFSLLNADPGVQKTITLKQNTEDTFNTIKNFIDKYNSIIDVVNGKLSEKYERNYLPLTDEQKEAMKEDDIKKWEEIAKKGLLRNDSILQNITSSMRKAVYDIIGGLGDNIAGIGITTGTYEQRGKLIINETKLKQALQDNPDRVMNIFSKQSSIAYSPNLNAADRTRRYEESGVAHRLHDILQDNIRMTRDNTGRKGVLLEKAGILGDMSDTNNLINNEIKGYNSRMDSLMNSLVSKENNYYKKFAAMEKMLSQMNSQSNWLAAQFSQGK